LNNAVKKQEPLRCPHCDSRQLFETAKGCLTICLVCFKTIKAGPHWPKRGISWTCMAIRAGVGAGIVAAGGLASAAVYEWHASDAMARETPASETRLTHRPKTGASALSAYRSGITPSDLRNAVAE
jgi:DNA-directed RNA polymerase subunit RPC12/RpoP